MKTSIRELRMSLKHILGTVQQGKVVTIYSRKQPIAKIIPIAKRRLAPTDVGFGMWKDYAKMSDVDRYIRKLRKGRQHDI